MDYLYLEVISFVERLRRQFLEVVKLELEGLGYAASTERVGSVSRENVTERLDVMLYREKPTNQLALLCRPAGAASHSFSFDHRRRPETLRTAIATAFFWPTSTISRFPRVTPV